MTRRNQHEPGFALLLTILVVSVVVSITVTIIELTLKQVALAVTARDSEIAFHAANAGMECVRYMSRMASSSIANRDNNIRFYCFGQSQEVGRQNRVLSVSGGDGDITHYAGLVTWNTGDRCSSVDMVVMQVDEGEASDMVINNLETIYPGFPATDNKSCTPGSRCIVAEVTGYNKPCNAITEPGTVRREILLEF